MILFPPRQQFSRLHLTHSPSNAITAPCVQSQILIAPLSRSTMRCQGGQTLSLFQQTLAEYFLLHLRGSDTPRVLTFAHMPLRFV